MTPSQFSFVSWTPGKQRSMQEDLQIRSHCMKGKNKRVDSRRSKREAKKALLENYEEASAADPVEDSRAKSFVDCLWILQCRNWIPTAVRSLPTLVELHPRLVKLAENAQKSPRGLLNEFTIFLRVQEVMNLVEAFVDFRIPQDQCNLPPLDDTLVQGMLLINSTATDYGQKRPFSETSAPILVKTLHLLNKKLTRRESYLEISTIYTIAFLAVVAAASGEVAALKAHMSGLHRIIELRGGFASLRPWPKLQAKLDSLDGVLALSSGGDPYFLVGCPPVEDLSPAGLPPGVLDSDFFMLLDPRLRTLYWDLQCLTMVINQHSNSHRKVDVDMYRPAIRTIAIRILQIERSLCDATDICLCLGMMAFILSLFQMPTKPPTFAYMTSRLQAATQLVQDFPNPPPPAIMTWLLIVSAVSFVEPMDPWLHATWADVTRPGLSWERVHEQLKEVLWIDGVHDNLGKAAFTVLITSQGLGNMLSPSYLDTSGYWSLTYLEP